jgi:hypothetical protein
MVAIRQLILGAATVFAVACGNGDGEGQDPDAAVGDAPPEGDGDVAADADAAPPEGDGDVATDADAAPPEGDGDDATDADAAPRLDEAHAGWRRPLCFNCHGVTVIYPHEGSGLSPPDCRGCHGTNGAPTPGHAVPESGMCTDCHRAVSHFADFSAPEDCLACHRP